MAEISKSGTPSLCSVLPPANDQIAGLITGEDVGAWDACYIKNDGLIYRSTGAAANAAARVDGFAAMATKSGRPVTLYRNARANYGSGLTPGARYFVSATVAGGLADAATTGGTAPVASAIDATRIQVNPSTY